jgi:anaerobic ribonucleoside-triphosphate reductase activating protein
MSRVLKYPVVNTDITFNELPDKMAYAIELGACKQHCVGCHSPELQEEDAPLTSLLDVLEEAQDAIDAGANAIVVMGGTNNKHITAESLISLLSALSDIAPVGIYSGSEDEERDKMIALEGHCTWLKTGPYVEALGGLESPRTNQRFYYISQSYRLDKNDNVVFVRPCFLDETHKFWKRVKNVT